MMYDLTGFTLRDMSELGIALRQLGRGAQSMEEVADRVVRYLCDHLVDKASGSRSCALIRLFKTHPYEDLGAELQAFSRNMLDSETIPAGMRCLVLLATAGERPAWNSRELSIRHKAIPMPSPNMVEAFPMISSLIEQFGLDIAHVLKPEGTILVELEQRTYNVFYVPDAVGSPYVYAQEEFVIPFGIQSVLGFGAMLPSGNLFAVILFSKAAIPRVTADLLAPVALSLKLALLPFDGGVVFAPPHSAPGEG
jgi:hypothetical protein